jgi:hypothetical protein
VKVLWCRRELNPRIATLNLGSDQVSDSLPSTVCAYGLKFIYSIPDLYVHLLVYKSGCLVSVSGVLCFSIVRFYLVDLRQCA